MKKTPTISSLKGNNGESNQMNITAFSETSCQGQGQLGLIPPINNQIISNQIKFDEKKSKDNNNYRNLTKKATNIGNKMGNVYTLIYYQGNFIITIGPQYYLSLILCLIITSALILSQLFIYRHLYFAFKVINALIYIIQISTQAYTTLINPGIPSQKYFLSDNVINLVTKDPIYNQRFDFNKYQICKVCNLLLDKDNNTIHCVDCNICCINHDHHCPWIGKCIGKNNLMSFKMFVFSTFLYFGYSFLSILVLLVSLT